jgi:tetratricopeptide (TPR) repeat protein
MAAMTELLAKASRLQAEGRAQEALGIFEQVVQKTIQDPYALYCLASCYTSLGFNGTAMNLLMRAIALSENPDWLAEAWNNLGVCFRQEAHEKEAVGAYLKSLELAPGESSTWGNLSGVFVNAGAPDECLKYAEQALSLDRFNAQAGNHKALALLEKGDYENGWKWYASRLRLPEFHRRKFTCQMWNGEKTGLLAIHGEQGIGDEIMFASLFKEAQKRADRVVVECTERLIPIFQRSFGIKAYKDEDVLLEAEKPDHWVAMGSLAGVLKQYAPLEHQGYIEPNALRVQKWKQKYPGFRVGISWRGGAKKTHEHLRNFDTAIWSKLTRMGRFISLQYGDWDHELAGLGAVRADVENFDDHLALVAACDLVVTVCNTTVHQAGSMNIPCWCLTPSKPAWRYGMTGERMFWYPSVKLIRQQPEEPWEAVLDRVCADYAELRRAESKAA